MGVFATEFPVKVSIKKADFLALALAWVRGIQHTTLNITPSAVENYGSEVVLTGSAGERFTVKEIDTELGFLIGARYDYFDDHRTNWRTEVVLTNDNGMASLRVRGQSIGPTNDQLLPDPKKPYFIKACLQEGWGAIDGTLPVSDQPHLLQITDIDQAVDVIQGRHRAALPIVYVSADSDGRYKLDPVKLAYDLGGVAHVVVEPNRAFSFRLKDLTEGLNPYAGTIGFCARDVGVYRRFYLGGLYPERRYLEGAVRRFATTQSSVRRPEFGLEWQDLQSEYARLRRVKAPRQEDRAYIDLLETEVATLKETIQNLKEQIETLSRASVVDRNDNGMLSGDIPEQIGQQLYEGEISDRVRAALKLCAEHPSFELHQRTREILMRIIQVTEFSGHGARLVQDLKRAAKQDRRATGELAEILSRLGFFLSEDGKHIKATPTPDLFGIGVITLAKTPGDWRSAANAASQIIGELGLASMNRT